MTTPNSEDPAYPDSFADRLGPSSRFFPGVQGRPWLVAHRGFALDGAENTMRAFSDALAHGATMLETDAHATADGTALCMHDPTLTRLAGVDRSVASLSDAELPQFSIAGHEPIATLADMLGTFTSVPVSIDVKNAEAIAPVARAIALTRAARRVCVTSFNDAVARSAVEAVRATSGVIPMRSPSRMAIARFLAACAVEAPRLVTNQLLRRYQVLQVPVQMRGVSVVTARTIAAAHHAGCEVHVWTIDDPHRMRELLDAGVDGIITNRVDQLQQVLGTARR